MHPPNNFIPKSQDDLLVVNKKNPAQRRGKKHTLVFS